MHAMGYLSIDPVKLSAIEQHPAQHPDPSIKNPRQYYSLPKVLRSGRKLSSVGLLSVGLI